MFLLMSALANAGVEVSIERPNGSVLLETGAEDSGRVVIDWKGDSYLVEYGLEGDTVWTRVTEFAIVDGVSEFQLLELSTTDSKGVIREDQWADSFSDRRGLTLVVSRSD